MRPKMLVLSNYLHTPYPSDVEICTWGSDRPSLTGYPIVILDLNLPGTKGAIGKYVFCNLYEEVHRLLKAGGVIICLNHLTFTNQGADLTGSAYDWVRAMKVFFQYGHKGESKYETNYDWLDQGFLRATKLDRTDARIAEQMEVVVGTRVVKEYFYYVSCFHKVIDGVSEHPEGRKDVLWWDHRGSPSAKPKPVRDPTRILAVNKITGEPVAAEIRYSGYLGGLIFLPTYRDLPPENPEEVALSITYRLYELGCKYYETYREEFGVPSVAPEWVREYRAKQALELDKQIDTLEEEIATMKANRDNYHRMLNLLYGTGRSLEDTVADLFGEKWLGFQVRKTEKGAALDMFVEGPAQEHKLAIEVTGVKGSFNKDNPHFADVLQYLPTNAENNANGEVERIVLIVNTYREKDPRNRNHKDDFTQPTMEIAENNEICYLRTYDLYRLWLDYLDESRSSSEIFEEIFNTVGVFRYRRPTSKT